MPSSRCQVPKSWCHCQTSLVHVDFFAKHLLERFNQARVAAEDREGLVIGVGRECRARGAGGFAPDFFAVFGVDFLAFIAQDGDFFR